MTGHSLRAGTFLVETIDVFSTKFDLPGASRPTACPDSMSMRLALGI